MREEELQVAEPGLLRHHGIVPGDDHVRVAKGGEHARQQLVTHPLHAAVPRQTTNPLLRVGDRGIAGENVFDAHIVDASVEQHERDIVRRDRAADVAVSFISPAADVAVSLTVWTASCALGASSSFISAAAEVTASFTGSFTSATWSLTWAASCCSFCVAGHSAENR